MKLPALLLAFVSASCLADVQNEPVGDAVEPGVHPGGGSAIRSPPPRDPIGDAHAWLRAHPGACSEACYDAWAMICGDADVCNGSDVQADDTVTCADVSLTCLDVRRAEYGEVAGLEECRSLCVARQ